MELKGSKCTCLPKFSGGQQTTTGTGLDQQNERKVCSAYCKYLTPKQQKKVILNLIKKEQNKQMLTGQWEPKRYLINQKWWTQWCDHVNFDSKISLDNSCDINLLPKQKTGDAEAYNSRGWFDSQSNADEGLSISEACSNEDQSQQLYERPPRIINIGLLDPYVPKGQRQRLKANLIEHFDFESLYPSVWKHFYSWYSADVQIVRSLKKDVLNRHVMKLDLYPDSDSRQFTGYEYASGCQNLFSGHNSARDSIKANNTELNGEESKGIEKPTFDLSELKKAQDDFMK